MQGVGLGLATDQTFYTLANNIVLNPSNAANSLLPSAPGSTANSFAISKLNGLRRQYLRQRQRRCL